MNVTEIKKAHEQGLDKLINECKVFWAFSNEQFQESKTELKEGEKYVSIGAGGYLPKGNLQMFIDGMENLRKEYNQAMKANKSNVNEAIMYELNNYECFYTGDISEAVNALKGVCTAKQVRAVYVKALQTTEA